MYTTALLALATTASATIQGFNYGSTFTDQSCKLQSDFEADFKTSQGLVGASGFTSARIYTMVQCGSANDPISAIPAAISTKTSLLLGVWASAGDASFKNELAALQKAISQYGDSFTKIVDGISVGSEDLYRNSPMGIAAGSDVGAEPATIISYIQQVRDALKGTSLSSVQVGHVDTWTAWANGSNVAVANACDWVGVDAYPYFQDTMTNDIGQGGSLFDSAIAQTQAGIGGKPIWVTETGWPVSGKTSGQALPSLDNAKNYWDTVGCGKLFGKVNTWWFTLQDAAKATPNPSFGLVGSTLSTTPLYDLSCKNVSSSSSSSASAGASSTATTLSSVASSSGAAKATASASGSTGGSPGVSGLVSSNSSQASATGSGVATPTGASGSGSSGSSSGSSGSSSGSSSNGSGSSGSSSGSSSSGSGSSGSSSGTGAGTGSSAGNGSTGSNSTVTTGAPSKPSAITSSSVRVESFGAALAALMMTICML